MWLGEVYWKDEHPSVGKTLDKHPIMIMIKLKNKTLKTCQFCLNSFTQTKRCLVIYSEEKFYVTQVYFVPTLLHISILSSIIVITLIIVDLKVYVCLLNTYSKPLTKANYLSYQNNINSLQNAIVCQDLSGGIEVVLIHSKSVKFRNEISLHI